MVITPADTHKDSAVSNIDAAIEHLSAIVIERAFGTDDFTDVYYAKLKAALYTLIDLRDSLI